MGEDTRDADGSVSTERRGALWLMGFNRPEKYNGLTPRMMRDLEDAYTTLESDKDLRVGIVFGHGKHFTAGLDLPKWRERMQAGGRERSNDRIDPFALSARRSTKPIITAVHGITYTAGIELMLAGDIVVAADDCRFSQLEPKRGIMATGGATFRYVERAGWGNAMYHLLMVDEFGAGEAHRCGFVQEVVAAGAQLDRAIEIGEKIAALAPLAIRATKASARQYADQGEEACWSSFREVQKRLANSEDAEEGVRSFKERRDPVFSGK